MDFMFQSDGPVQINQKKRYSFSAIPFHLFSYELMQEMGLEPTRAHCSQDP